MKDLATCDVWLGLLNCKLEIQLEKVFERTVVALYTM